MSCETRSSTPIWKRGSTNAFRLTANKFARLSALCAEGEAEGWLMSREAGGIKFERAVKPGNEARRFSVDVVRMKNVAGPHHVHTTGEPPIRWEAEGLVCLPAGI